jgi:hypothetical protein
MFRIKRMQSKSGARPYAKVVPLIPNFPMAAVCEKCFGRNIEFRQGDGDRN